MSEARLAMGVGEFIESVFPSRFNKNDPVFCALLRGLEGAPPGVMEKMFLDFESARADWCNGSDVYTLEGIRLRKALSLFSVLLENLSEGDEGVRRKNKIVYTRGGDTVWGDRFDVQKVYRLYLRNAFIYVINNAYHIKESLIADGAFDELGIGAQTGNYWELAGDCACDSEARLVGWYGLSFKGAGARASQTVRLSGAGCYVLHFFCAGTIRVKVESEGLVWEGESFRGASNSARGLCSWASADSGAGQEGEIFEGAPDAWAPFQLFFIAKKEMKEARITFSYASGRAYVDYVRLFKKDAGACFSVTSVFASSTHEKALGLTPSYDDSLIDYSKMSYIEDAHIWGSEMEHKGGEFAELLRLLRPTGVEGFFEFLTRERAPA